MLQKLLGKWKREKSPREPVYFFRVQGGSYGECEAVFSDAGIRLAGQTLSFDDIRLVEVERLQLVHDAMYPVGNGSKATLMLFPFGIGYPVASTYCSGNVLEVTFSLETNHGEKFLASADIGVFHALRKRVFGDHAQDGWEEEFQESGE